MSKNKNTEIPNAETIKNMEEFASQIAKKVKKSIGVGCQVRVQTVTKTNQVTLQGLVILSKKSNVSPTIYLEPFWESYQNGVPLEILTEKIVTIYKEDTPKNSIDLEFFKEFEKVKDRICYRLIHRAENEALLQKIPHKEFLDMAICFYYAYQNPEMGDGTILLYNNHMEAWGTTVEELHLLAKENTPKLFPWESISLRDMVEEMFGVKDCNDYFRESCEERDGCNPLADRITMQVLGNSKHVHGAAVLLYDGVTEQMAELLGGSYYILPSSVHEVILLKDSGKEETKVLKEMIADVNRTQVPPEEVLSNSLYFYDFVEKMVKIV